MMTLQPGQRNISREHYDPLHREMDFPLKRTVKLSPTNTTQSSFFVIWAVEQMEERSRMKVNFSELFGQMRTSESSEGQKR